ASRRACVYEHRGSIASDYSHGDRMCQLVLFEAEFVGLSCPLRGQNVVRVHRIPEHYATRMGVIRPAFSNWPDYNRSFREVITALTDDQLAMRPSPERWPMWATVGHAACQRVFWLCDFAGEPGAETTPFPNAASNCPGDDDL